MTRPPLENGIFVQKGAPSVGERIENALKHAMKHSTVPLKTILLFTVIFPVFVPVVRAEETKQAVLPFDTPDPTLLKDPGGSGFYLFTTGRGIPITRSRNLLDWERLSPVFPGVPDWAKKMIPEARGIWAPDIVALDGRYFLYYSVSTFGSQRSVIGLAVNKTLDPDSPDYAWEDRGLVLESAPDHTDYNAIDSALFVDEDGRAYLFWGSYWTGLKAVEVDSKTGKPFSYKPGEMKIPAGYIAVATRDGEDTSLEAPYVIRRGKFYYLFTSRGSCCDKEKSTYRLVIGRATEPLGPYLDKNGKRMDEGGGTLLLASTERWKGTGHNGFFRTKNEDGSENDWLILAAYDVRAPKKGRLTQLRPVSWDTDAWPLVGEIPDRPFENRENNSNSIEPGGAGPR